MRFWIVVFLASYLSTNYVKAVDDYEFTDTGIKISYNRSKNQLTFNSEEDKTNLLATLQKGKGYIAFSEEISKNLLESSTDFPTPPQISNMVLKMEFKNDSQNRHVLISPNKVICFLGKPADSQEFEQFKNAKFECIEGPIDLGICAHTAAIRARYIVRTIGAESEGKTWATCNVLISLLNKNVTFNVSEN